MAWPWLHRFEPRYAWPQSLLLTTVHGRHYLYFIDKPSEAERKKATGSRSPSWLGGQVGCGTRSSDAWPNTPFTSLINGRTIANELLKDIVIGWYPMLPNTYYYKILHSTLLWSLGSPIGPKNALGDSWRHTTGPQVSQRKTRPTIPASRGLHTIVLVSTLQILIFQDLPKKFLPLRRQQLVPSAGKYVHLFVTKVRPNYLYQRLTKTRAICFLHRIFCSRMSINSYLQLFHR